MAWEVGSLPRLMGVEASLRRVGCGVEQVCRGRRDCCHTLPGPSSQNRSGEPSWLAPFTPVSVRGEVAEI